MEQFLDLWKAHPPVHDSMVKHLITSTAAASAEEGSSAAGGRRENSGWRHLKAAYVDGERVAAASCQRRR
jgi:hypothetical protein